MAGPIGDLSLSVMREEPPAPAAAPRPSSGSGGGPRVPSLQEWLTQAKNSLPANTERGTRRYPRKFVHDYLTKAAENWSTLYGQQMPKPPNELQVAESGLRQKLTQKRIDQVGQPRPWHPEERDLVVYRGQTEQARAGLIGDQRDTEGMKQGLYDVRMAKTARERDLLGQPTWKDQQWVRMQEPYMQARTGQVTAGTDLIGDKRKTEGKRGQKIDADIGLVTKRTQEVGKPTTATGGGKPSAPAKPYEQQEDDYIFQGLERWRKSAAGPSVEEANESAATGIGPDFLYGKAAPKAALLAAEAEEKERLRREFRARYPRQTADAITGAGGDLMERLDRLDAREAEIQRLLAGGGP